MMKRHSVKTVDPLKKRNAKSSSKSPSSGLHASAAFVALAEGFDFVFDEYYFEVIRPFIHVMSNWPYIASFRNRIAKA